MGSSKKKLHIAFVVSTFPTVSETFIVNQICDLIDRGHHVTIFSFNNNETGIVHRKIKDYKLLERTRYHRPKQVSKIKRYFPFLRFLFRHFRNIDLGRLLLNFKFPGKGIRTLNLEFFYKYYWILNNSGFDIIHAHFGPNGSYVAQMKANGFLKKTGFLTTFHGYDLTPKLLPEFKIKYEELFLQADFLTVNTEYSKALLRKITSREVKIVPVGLDILRFLNKKKDIVSPVKIIFIGRLIALKGPHLAIKIFQILKDRGFSNTKLIIVGEGEMKKELLQLIADHNLENDIELKGALDQNEVIKELRASHIFLLPGIYDESGRAETQGLVIQEAQAMEVPVIVSDAGGMKYGLLDGVTGFVVKQGDIKSFADKIEYLILNKDKRIEMGRRGREFVRENYDSGILGDKLENLYYSLL